MTSTAGNRPPEVSKSAQDAPDRRAPDGGPLAPQRLPDNALNRFIDRLDGWQRRFTPVSFGFAVIKKFGDDRCGQFAALLSYYGFFSLFPLLLVLVTVLGVVLQDKPDLQRDLLDSAVSNFPVVGDKIAESVSAPSGSVVAVVVAVVLALWAGLGATQVGQDALNAVFGVPVLRRKNFWIRQLRGLLTLGVFGTAVVVITGLGAVAAWLGPSTVLGRVGLLIGTAAINMLLVSALFRVLVHQPLGVRKIWPGALFGGVTWTALQYLGSFYVERSVSGASRTYGFFAVVIGLLSWIYLQAQLFLYAAQVSAVADARLWPRSIVREYPTAADIQVADLIEDREQRVKESERDWRAQHRARAQRAE
jgi:inner membrane protein YhjD